jgi:serine/threonine-protein kinase
VELDTILAQPKRLALLVTLVVGPPGFRRRDSLLALLWPELDQTHARAALNQAVRFLRKEVGDLSGTVIISRGTEELGVATSSFWCDAMALREHVEAGRHREALELYRGDLLEGFFADHGDGFQEWLERERNLLRLTAARAARTVAGIHEQAGDLTPAVAAARRSVALAEADERVVRELMQLLDRLGDRAGAIQVFEEFANRLSADFNASPAPETREVIDQIRKRGAATRSALASSIPDDRPAVSPPGGRPSPPIAHPVTPRLPDVPAGDNHHGNHSTPQAGSASGAQRLMRTVVRGGPWLLAGASMGLLAGRCLP